MAIVIDEGKMVVPISPAKNRSTLAIIPKYALTLLKTLLPSITTEKIKAPINKPLRPAV